MQTVLGLLLLLSLLGQSQGRGGGGRGGPGGPPFGGPGNRNNSDKSAWNRTIDTTNIRQFGFVNESGKEVVVITYGRELSQQNISESIVVYNYTGQITVLKSGPTCYITKSSSVSNYDSASTDVTARNGTNVTAPLTEVRLNATGQRLDEEARKAVIAENPGVGKLCAHGQIYNTTAADDAASPVTETPGTGPREINVVGLNELYRIVSNDIAPNGFGPGRHPGGKPGKRPHEPSRGKLDKGRGGPRSEAQTTTSGI